MTFQWTISRKLAGLVALALAFIVAVAATGLLAAAQLTRANERMLQDGVALRHQMRADQAHDALRANVLAAIELGMRHDPQRQKAIRDELAQHAERVRTALQELERMQRAAVQAVQPALEQTWPSRPRW